jgi:hypothetical protein
VYLYISTHIIRRTKVFCRDTTSERRKKSDGRGPTNKILNYGTVGSPKGGLILRVPNKYKNIILNVYMYDINLLLNFYLNLLLNLLLNRNLNLCGDGAPIVGSDFNMSSRLNKGL